MRISDLCSNDAITKEIGARIQKTRIDYPLSQDELASRSGLSKRTIANIERGADTNLSSLISVLRAMNLLSRMELLLDPCETHPSEILTQSKRPKRVRTTKKHSDSSSWKWGDEQ